MSGPDSKKLSLASQLVHAGEPDRVLGAVTLPIFQSSTFESGDESTYHDVRYLRLNNSPNHLALNEKLRAIEGGEAALIASSGMAAISTTLLSLLKPGDHVLAQTGVYGGTHALLTHDLVELGVETEFFDGADVDALAKKVRPTTKVIYCEAMTNPLVRVGALPEIAALAKRVGAVSLIDATFATPVNFRPLEHGFDGVLHSATKYLNGHSDMIAGALVGGTELVEKTLHKLNHLGGSLDPHACFLLHRGLKTLSLRVGQHNASALALARALLEEPKVAEVHYPGLESHPDHQRASRIMSGFGGMLSFELAGGRAAAEAAFKSLELAVNAPSLGGPETLVTRPAVTSHAGMTPAQREAIGISDGLIRVSVGLEGTVDLVDDFVRAVRRS